MNALDSLPEGSTIHKDNEYMLSSDKLNSSLNNLDSRQDLFLQSHTKENSLQYFSQQLLDFFSIRLCNLEESYSRKEIEVTDYMFKLHYITITANDIQSQLPKPPPSKNFSRRNKGDMDTDDELNSSKLSTVSRRSVSSRMSKKDFATTKIGAGGKDRLALFTPKVAINIGLKQGGGKENPLEKSINPGKSVDSKLKQAPTKIIEDKSKKPVPVEKVPVNDKIKTVNIANENNENNKPHKLNNRKINSDGDNLVKKTKAQNIQPQSNQNSANKGKSSQQANRVSTTSSNDIKMQKPGGSNSKLSPNANNSSPKTTYAKPGNPNNKSKDIIEKKDSKKDLFVAGNNKASFKFEPKQGKKSINYTNVQEILNNNEKDIFKFDDKNEKFGSLAAHRVLRFLQVKDKVNFKSASKKFRAYFFLSEITDMDRKIQMKKNEENPLFLAVFPESLINKSKSISLNILSYEDSLNEDPSFNNLINALSITIFPNNISLISGKFLAQKMKEIETLMKSTNTKNIYDLLPVIINNVKYNVEIFNTFKSMIAENSNFFKFQGLNSEFNCLVDFFNIIQKQIAIGENMEIVIDLEILQHKLEILKSYQN